MSNANKLSAHPEVRRTMHGMTLPPAALRVAAGWNVRVRDAQLTAHIRGIADSIKGGAKLPPLQVYADADGHPVIVDGHCRYEAIQLEISEGCEIAQVQVAEFVGNDADRVAFMFTSSQGKSLSQYEQAVVFNRLKHFGWTTEAISTRCGKSEGFVDRMLRLANADADVQVLVKEGKVAAGAAVAAIRKTPKNTGKVLTAAYERKVADAGGVQGSVVVTERDVLGATITKTTQAELLTLFDTLPASLGEEEYAFAQGLMGMNAAMLEGEVIQVPAVVVVELIRLRTILTQIDRGLT